MEDNGNKPGLSAGEAMNEAPVVPTTNTGYTGQPDQLQDLFGPGGSKTSTDEEDPLAALRNDPNYAALIRDLEYIAAQARDLFKPAEEAPSDEVWNKIQREMSKGSSETES